MNSFKKNFGLWLIAFITLLLACVIAKALSQPLQAAEKRDLPLASGYIPTEPLRRSQAPRKAVSVSSGYIVSVETGKTEQVTVRTYQSGSRVVTEGQIGLRNIRIETPVPKEKE